MHCRAAKDRKFACLLAFCINGPSQFYTICIHGPSKFYTVARFVVFSDPIFKDYSEAGSLHIYILTALFLLFSNKSSQRSIISGQKFACLLAMLYVMPVMRMMLVMLCQKHHYLKMI